MSLLSRCLSLRQFSLLQLLLFGNVGGPLAGKHVVYLHALGLRFGVTDVASGALRGSDFTDYVVTSPLQAWQELVFEVSDRNVPFAGA